MSTQPTDDDSPPPTPTAQRSERGPIPSAVLDRRTFLRGTAAAGAAAIGGAGTATAEDDDDTGYNNYWADNYNLTSRISGLLNIDDGINDDPSADETSLHLQIQDQGEWFDDHDQILENHYQDTRELAHIDARYEIVNEWEDGGNSSEGYDAALDGIRSYYWIHEHNDINAGLRVMSNFAHFCDVARANDDINDDLLTLPCEREDTGDLVNGVVTADFDEMSFDLLNGDEFTVPVPMIEFYEPGGDGLGDFVGETRLQPSTIMEPDGDEWHNTELTFDMSPTNITTGGSWTLQNLSGYEDDDGDLEFPGDPNVWDMSYWAQQVARHDEEAASVEAAYDEGLVDEIYQALDDEEISPIDVRSSVGLARHMGGTEDAQADSYRLALLMQLGIDQPDLEGVASMTVNYTGATGSNVVREDNTRHLYPSDIVSDDEYEGLLYARETPDQGYVTGETLVADPYVTFFKDGEVVVKNIHGDTLWTIEDHDLSNFDGQTAYSLNSARIAVSDADGNVGCFDATTGDQLWSDSASTDEFQLQWGPDGETLYGADGKEGDSNIIGWDGQDGSILLDANPTGSPTGLEVSEDGSELYVSDGSGFTVVDTDTGDTDHHDLGFADPMDIAYYPETELLVVGGDQEIIAVDPSDPTTEDWNTNVGGEVWAVTADPREEFVVVYEETDDYLLAYDLDDGAEVWSYLGDFTSTNAAAVGDGSYFAFADSGEGTSLIDREGQQFGTVSDDSNTSVCAQSHRDADGILQRSIIYDATDSQEIRATNGLVEIVEQVDRDGEEVEQSDIDQPEYGTNDVTEYTEQVEKHTTVYEETIVNNYDTGDDGGDWWPSVSGPDFGAGGFGGQLAGLAVIAAIVVSVIWSVVSDAVPFLGN